MSRGRWPPGLDVQVDQCGDTRLLQLGRPEVRGVHLVEPTQQMTDGVVDMGGLAAGTMQTECDGAILERCVGQNGEVDDRDLAAALGLRLQGALSSMILRVSALSAAAWRASAAWRSRSFLSAVGSQPVATARLMAAAAVRASSGDISTASPMTWAFSWWRLPVEVDPAWPRRHRPAGRAAADDETETWTGLVEKHGALAATASCLDLALDNRRRQADLARATARLRESIGGRHGGSHLAERSSILPKQLRKQSWARYGTSR